MQRLFSFVFLYLLLLTPVQAAEPTIFLQAQGKFLLVLHALLAILLLGSMTHNVLICVRYLGGNFARIRLEKLYVKVAFVAYLLTFGLGSVIYPNYRHHVRAQYFDLHQPWASHLFDVKEHWSAIGLALFAAFLLLSYLIEPRQDRSWLPFYVFLSVCLASIVWFSLITGLILVSYRSI
jgi:hypothetical protein